jgi:hypothetical protein
MYFEKELEIHKEIFPQATPQDQLWHLCEELNEIDSAFNEQDFDNMQKEWADALFVAISLQRFAYTRHLANIMIYNLYEQYPRAIQIKIDGYLEKAIKKVKSRKYYFINGHYEREKNV